MMRIITLKASCILAFSCLLLFLKSHSYQGNALEDYIDGNQDVGVITSLKTEGNMLDESKGVGRNLQTETCVAKAFQHASFCSNQCPSQSNSKCKKRCVCDTKASIISQGSLTCKAKNESASANTRTFCSTKCKFPNSGNSQKCSNKCKCKFESERGCPAKQSKPTWGNFCSKNCPSPGDSKCKKRCACDPKPATGDTCVAKAFKHVDFCENKCPSNNIDDYDYRRCEQRCLCDAKVSIISQGSLTCRAKNESASTKIKTFCSNECPLDITLIKCSNKCRC